MDLFSRKIVGWAVTPTIGRGLVLDAVLMAVLRRRPKKTIIHSDQGSRRVNLTPSITRTAVRRISRAALESLPTDADVR